MLPIVWTGIVAYIAAFWMTIIHFAVPGIRPFTLFVGILFAFGVLGLLMLVANSAPPPIRRYIRR